MKNIILHIIITTVLLNCPVLTSAQQILELEDVLKLATEHSCRIKTAGYQQELANSRFDFFKSQLRPTVSLESSLPGYTKTSSPVVQPDGAVAFQTIRQANSFLSANASQVIPLTGGTLFVSTSLQRFDDFSFNNKLYNGIPIRVGINQPLRKYNFWKFQKTVLELELKVAQLQYKQAMELTAVQTAILFFEVLQATQQLDIATANQTANERLMVITEERLALGKISKEAYLQLEIELQNASLLAIKATIQQTIAVSDLFGFLGLNSPEMTTSFKWPEPPMLSFIETDKLIAAFHKNQPELAVFKKELKSTEQDLAQAKADYGFQANLQASIGLTRSSKQLAEVYTNPFDEQQFNVTLSLPILDGGKRKSAMETVSIRRKDILASKQQRLLELENSIHQRIKQLNSLQQELSIQKEIMQKTEERYQIVNKRYMLGDVDLTNLTLAQREKDEKKRNYLNTLKAYWISYYDLRALTGYDIIANSEID